MIDTLATWDKEVSLPRLIPFFNIQIILVGIALFLSRSSEYSSRGCDRSCETVKMLLRFALSSNVFLTLPLRAIDSRRHRHKKATSLLRGDAALVAHNIPEPTDYLQMLSFHDDRQLQTSSVIIMQIGCHLVALSCCRCPFRLSHC